MSSTTTSHSGSAAGPRLDGTGIRVHPTVADILNRLKSGSTFFGIRSLEEPRVIEGIRNALRNTSDANHREKAENIYVWSATQGLRSLKDVEAEADGLRPIPSDFPPEKLRGEERERLIREYHERLRTSDPAQALRDVIAHAKEENRVYFFNALHPYFGDGPIVRLLQEAAYALNRQATTGRSALMLVSAGLVVPDDLANEIYEVNYPLPTPMEVHAHLDLAIQSVRRRAPEKASPSPEEQAAIVRALVGLTESRAETALANVIVQAGEISGKIVPLLNREKRQIISQSSALQVIEVEESMETAGGLDQMKEWVHKRAYAYTDDAQTRGVRFPKGMLMLGLPGSGKSLAAKAVAHKLNLPLIRFNFGAIFGGLVGASEANLRKAIQVIEGHGACVLWLDELEKAMGQGGLDGGTTTRVLGEFLTWLSDQRTVFLYCTANDVSKLPPELMRRGRFDVTFYTGLPAATERREIFAIHLRKRDQDLDRFELDEVVEESEGMVGAEIEAVVEDALLEAAVEQRLMDTNDLVKAIHESVPLVKTQAEKVKALLEWVRDGRARNASSEPEVSLERVIGKWDRRQEERERQREMASRRPAAPEPCSIPLQERTQEMAATSVRRTESPVAVRRFRDPNF